MIKGKVIEFGYGDVVVGNDWFKECITITNIKPPLECGKTIRRGVEGIEFGESIEIYEDELHDIYKLICTVDEYNRVVKYKEWTFDFTNYNKESVKVVRDSAWSIVSPMLLAC